ncbi:hypothetical protein [Algibacter aquimarinus]|uniref:Uncharacterized protein n=1 Tax=Algibacter aquimarinus TaxID=1136748 RepID=A0ABP9HGV7_9FLAO
MFNSNRLHLKEIKESSLILGVKKNTRRDIIINASEIYEICDSVLGKNADSVDLIFKTKNENIFLDMNSKWDLIVDFGKKNNIKIIREWVCESFQTIVINNPKIK